jgi:hypothetical protein
MQYRPRSGEERMGLKHLLAAWWQFAIVIAIYVGCMAYFHPEVSPTGTCRVS